MFHPRKRRDVKPLSLAVLLSFNELAWIVVGAITLVFVFFWREYQIQQNDPRIRISQEDYNELTNRPVMKANETIVDRAAWEELLNHSNIVSVPLRKYMLLTNRPFLQPGELAITRARWEAVMGSNTVRLPVSEYWQLTNRPVLAPDQVIVPVTTTQKLLAMYVSVDAFSNRLAAAQLEHSNYLHQAQNEGQIRAELLNLKGRLSNAVILLDRSSSMGEEKGRFGTNRWAEAVQVIESWLKYLTIKRCALLVFADDCQPFPEDRTFLEMNDSSRSKLIEHVRRLKPEGAYTATAQALATAYRDYPSVDTIILFTDGKPSAPRSRRASAKDDAAGTDTAISNAEIQRVQEIVSQHRSIPIDVVALGNYFEKDQAEFLLKLSRMTGGSFLGR